MGRERRVGSLGILCLFWRMKTAKAVEVAKTIELVRLVLLSSQFSLTFRT